MTFTDGTGRKVEIDLHKCAGCGACIAVCPARAIRMLPGWVCTADPERCIGCRTCMAL